MNVNIVHLYPDLLNLYGDNGNIKALCYRMQKRGIGVKVNECTSSSLPDFGDADLVFIGGGSDKEVAGVCKTLIGCRDELKAYVEDGGALFAVCGGFQILGKSFECGGTLCEGLGIYDINFTEQKERLIGNIVCDCAMLGTTVVGFENHSAIADIGDATPFCKVVTGYGNDVASGYEGIIYKNTLSTFMHGPLLPKNPAVADYIIQKSLFKKYGEVQLAPIDDTLENLAHDWAVSNFS